MTLDRFMVFATAAKHRNATRAAEQLHISQPAVTKQLKLLEHDYKTKLYKKKGKGIELTEAGRIFLREVRTILKRYEKLHEKFGGDADPSGVDSFTLGGSYSPSATLLPSLLAKFQKNHPHVRFDLRTDNTPSVARMVLKGDVDLAVINNPRVNSHLAMELYRTEPVVAFVRPDHPLAKKRRINREELGRFGLVVRKPLGGGSGTTTEYLKNLQKQGLRPKAVLRCDTPEGVKEGVRNQLGVGILFRDVVERHIKRGSFKVIKLPGDTFEGKSFIVYHKNRPLSPLAQDFLELLRSRRYKRKRIAAAVSRSTD